MKRRVKTIIGLACGALLCAGLAACTKAETELDRIEKENYIVGVPDQPIGSLVAAAVQKVKALCAGKGC